MKKRKVTAFLTILTASVMIASLAGCGTTDKRYMSQERMQYPYLQYPSPKRR